MMDRDELFVHLGGYASIAAILGTANWAGASGFILAFPITAAALYVGGSRLYGHFLRRARREVRSEGTPAATDGGSEERPRDTGGTRQQPESHNT